MLNDQLVHMGKLNLENVLFSLLLSLSLSKTQTHRHTLFSLAESLQAYAQFDVFFHLFGNHSQDDDYMQIN